MARRKAHHTVSEALLTGFSRDRQLVTRQRSGREFLTSVKNASVVSDFYAFVQEDGCSRDDAVEGWLAEVVESDFHGLLPELRSGAQPRRDDSDVIARFVSVAAIRTRTAWSYMTQIDWHIAGTVLLSVVAPKLGWHLALLSDREIEHRRHLCEQAWRELPPRRDAAESRLRTMIRESRRIEGRLSDYCWSVATSEDQALVIGDAPVLSITGRDGPGWHGLVPEGSWVFLPLSPLRVLVGQPTPFEKPRPVSRLASDLNRLTIREAFSDVFRHPESPWPASLVLGARSRQLPTPTRSFGRAPAGRKSTFPYTYPPMDDDETAAILRHLRAVDVVE